ncbi:type II toxin-antitoxin system prevent-host-death family antitoxin [Acetobacteraceae bacterium KSS8]|uniref:Antitoxin n=1 Tax=Endosaccharibacter trunci TaxID=2812733 RepID=A0ABT1W8L4_9PROT|nr:type II toxin-antitoxin system prevent-host-death family antitoxin [Acetobacteraceae bacterium KSS8]
MDYVSYTDLRQNLARHLNDVHERRAPLTVTRQGKGDVVLLSAEEYAGMEETLHLLRSPPNAERLLRSIRSARAGSATEHELVDPGA